MRTLVPSAVLSLALLGQVAAAQPCPGLPCPGLPSSGGSGDLAALERSWHACVREAFARQPRGQSRAASQRSALDACQAGEDAYVAAAMRLAGNAGDRGARRGMTERARAWAASVAEDVLDPVSAWLDALRR